MVVVDNEMKKVKKRNIEKEWKEKVIERKGIIMEILGERERKKEGEIKVEMENIK